ncbi:MAG: hypothetical protein HRF43_02910 [Phycisphaerae bacterium]
MNRTAYVWLRRLTVLCAGGCILQGGCARILTQELEVLFASPANATLIRSSLLVQLLGPGLLGLFN